MTKTILRIILSALIFSLIAGAIVVGIGLYLKWKTPIQFSDGLFWAGAAVLGITGLNMLGRSNQAPSGLMTNQSVVGDGPEERFKAWQEGTLRGWNLIIFLGASGLLLFVFSGLAIWVGKLF
jgi:hypothetical protein